MDLPKLFEGYPFVGARRTQHDVDQAPVGVRGTVESSKDRLSDIRRVGRPNHSARSPPTVVVVVPTTAAGVQGVSVQALQELDQRVDAAFGHEVRVQKKGTVARGHRLQTRVELDPAVPKLLLGSHMM
eukprot:2575578-Pyramimonas_sp.AAC.1